MNAPEWRLQILAGVGQLLRSLGFRGSKTRYWKDVGGRRIIVQLFGGSDPKDISKLSMAVYLGVDFLEFENSKKPKSAYLALWTGYLGWSNPQGTREVAWLAYSDEEAVEVMEGIQASLPAALARIEERFQTWHDVLPYLNTSIRLALDPPGKVREWKLPSVL